jgi:mono/diheme cytochrome c family protein
MAKRVRMRRDLLLISAVVGALAHTGPSFAADAEAGRSVAEAKCAQCHAANDWDGEDAPSLEDLIRDIVAGKVKHRGKLELSPQEIADIAAYWGSGETQRQRGKRR